MFYYNTTGNNIAQLAIISHNWRLLFLVNFNLQEKLGWGGGQTNKNK
jgi:hypothetical protein